jgi:hypothetical protein
MENIIEIKNSNKPKKTRKPKKVKDNKSKTKTKIKLNNTKKEKNKNSQSIKINISSSGGLGGSGGGGTPSIPIPIQTFSRNEKIGENVEVGNLLKRIENQQQSAINNLANVMNTSVIPAIMNSRNQNSIFEGEFEPEVEKKDLIDYKNKPLLQQINRDDNIDEAEKVNIDNVDVEDFYINNEEDEVEFGDTYKKKSIVPMIDNPLVFKRKEKIDEIPEPEQEVQKIQSMPLNLSLSQNPKRRGRPKNNNSPTATPKVLTVNKPFTRSKGLMATKKVSSNKT